LLITAPPKDARAIRAALDGEAIACTDIGVVMDGPAIVERTTAAGSETWPRPAVDAITKAFAA
jgi:hypothetical protein